MSHVGGRDSRAPDAINRYINAGLFNSEFRLGARGGEDLAASACRAARCGPVDVLLCEGAGPRYTRRALRHIRADHADDLLVVAPLRAKVEISQAGFTEHVVPEGFACLTTARPLHAITSALDPHERFSLYLVRVPAPLIRRQIPGIDERCGRFVAARQGAGKIMLRLFEEAIAERQALTEEQGRRLGTMLIDAIVNSTRGELDTGGAVSHMAGSSHARVYAQAKAYIEAHLSKPGLAADEVAQHCGTSRRYVDQAFAVHGTTVGSLIRESRLQACREELANSSLDHRTIAEIAFRWGFGDPAYFSRTYRSRFGHAPRTERLSPAPR